MRAGASAVLASGQAHIVDLVTLTIPRRWYSSVPPVGQAGTATILGATYPTVIMPDGKEWTTANLAWAGAGVWFQDGASDNGFGRYYLRSEVDTMISLLSPSGWRVPTRAEWQALVNAAGGTGAGNAFAVSGTLPNWNRDTGTNATGFSAIASGYREFGSWDGYAGNPGAYANLPTLRFWLSDLQPNGEYRYGNVDEFQTAPYAKGLGYLGTLNTYGSKALSIRLVRDDHGGTRPVDSPAVIRWTSHDRPLRFQGAVFQGLPGTVWTRGPRSDQVGSEVSTLACSVAGDLLVPWRTHPTDAAQVDQIDLSELAVLGLLEGATLQIDEAVLDSFPGAPAGESAADLPIGQVTTAVVLGEVVEASLDALSVAMRVRSFQHRAGASVPRAVFAPTCRWDFAGPECGYGSQWAERTALETTEESIRLSALQAEDFGSVVPLSGRNMGIRRTLGVGDNDGLERTYALPEPWPWPMADNTPVAVGFECSKGLSALTGRPSCTMLLRQARFGGFPGMPPPEGA